ncbi:MAG: hypothetical protein HRT44_09060 [Bdellovibrionales bacterium]|nr:hypothetical protein [Bdellovibrionales bacterium]NQZ19389.1 hypothetical protein [Bdellovibrionales bacterium]
MKSLSLTVLLSFLMQWTFINFSFAKAEIVFPEGKAEVLHYLDKVEKMSADILGFDPSKAKAKENNTEGSSMIVSGRQSLWLYKIDINNDGTEEYFTIFVFGGSQSTNGILSVLSKDLQSINFKKIISKSLWSDDSGDMSKMHLKLAAPAVVKEKGQFFIRYYDSKPNPKFTQYLWTKSNFKKTKESPSNSY